MIVIGGLIIGSVVGGIVWALDRRERQKRYTAERHEQQANVQAMNTIVTQLRENQVDLTTQSENNKRVMNEYKDRSGELKVQRDKVRTEVEKQKDQRDKLEQEKNDNEMNECFNRMGF